MFPDYNRMSTYGEFVEKLQRLIRDLNLLKHWKDNKIKGYQAVQYIKDESDNGGTSDSLSSLYRDINQDSKTVIKTYDGLGDRYNSDKWSYTIRIYQDDISYILDSHMYLIRRKIDDLLYISFDFKEGLGYTYIGHYEISEGLVRILLNSDNEIYKLDHIGDMESVDEVISLLII